jgi:hypothetical protein
MTPAAGKADQAVLVPGGDGFNSVPYIFSTVFVFKQGLINSVRLEK